MEDLLSILIIAIFLLSVPLAAQAIGWLSKRRTTRQTVASTRPGKTNKAESSYASN